VPILSLAEADESCGGKACWLAKLLPFCEVPPGFIVVGEADPDSVQAASQALGTVAVRSSSLQEDGHLESHAGQFLTLLQVSQDVYQAVSQVLQCQGQQGGVIVQRQVQSRWAGVLFTQDPLSSKSQARLEAHPGQGELVVSGRVQPSLWLAHGLEEWQLQHGPECLTAAQIGELWAVAQRLKNELGCDLDIEFAWDEQLWILQARPVTAHLQQREQARGREIRRLSSYSPSTQWSRQGLPESLPRPLPLSFDFACQLMAGPYTEVYRLLGYAPRARVPLLEMIAGRLFHNLEAESQMLWPWLELRQSKLVLKALHWKAPFQFLGMLTRLIYWSVHFDKIYAERSRQFLDSLQALQNQSLEHLSVAELLQRLEHIRQLTLEFATYCYLGAGLEAGQPRRLPPELEPRHLASLDKVELLRCLGHRGPLEMELAQPRWREIPDQLHFGQPSAASAKTSGLPVSRREQGRHHLMYGWAELRRTLLELDQRWGLQGQIFWLHWHELGEPRPSLDEIRSRQKQRKLLLSLECPEQISASCLEAIGQARPPSEGALQGLGLSWGVAEGPLLVVSQASQVPALAEGFVLACPTTDPGYTSAMTRAARLIVETGGTLSHGAIVARELSLPAVAGIPLENLRSGQAVRLNGQSGQVELL
jgi:phosphohistidine swiveling domain-containing protein